MRRFVLSLLLVSSLTVVTPAGEAGRLVRLRCDQETYSGKIEALGRDECWLMQQDGQLKRIKMDDIRGITPSAETFRLWKGSQISDRLRQEFGADLDIAGTSHYLVCARRGEARQYAELFEEIYRTFQQYFSTRGFKVARLEYPLVAIVFPDREQFVRYSQQHGVPMVQGMMGYYLKTTNRVVAYNPAPFNTSLFQQELPARMTNRPLPWRSAGREFGLPLDDLQPSRTAGGSSLEDTLIHEATHQMAYNTGLHERLGHNPMWVVEGMATVFEAANLRNSSTQGSPMTRVNPSRLGWFQDYRTQRRAGKSLEAFLRSDELFGKQVLDAYAEAWALTFFLIETRPEKYAGYLKQIATRRPLETYSGDDRLKDFRAAFGDDIAWLEVEFIRFMEQLK